MRSADGGLAGRLPRFLNILYNYVEIGEDKMTPAIRLGLVDKVITVGEVLDGK